MNVFRGRTLAVLLAAASALAAPLAAQELNVVERTLSNGMKVLMVARHDQPTVSCGWLARVGSANERPGITGLAHLFEHMMFKGTTTIGTKDAARDLELNRMQDEVQALIREEMAVLREKQRRGEIADMMDPAARTPRLGGAPREVRRARHPAARAHRQGRDGQDLPGERLDRAERVDEQ